jgi:hypothetical protein
MQVVVTLNGIPIYTTRGEFKLALIPQSKVYFLGPNGLPDYDDGSTTILWVVRHTTPGEFTLFRKYCDMINSFHNTPNIRIYFEILPIETTEVYISVINEADRKKYATDYADKVSISQRFTSDSVKYTMPQ